jgi:hypothetical protein
MHLIVIAWLYVAILMAATESSLVGGLLTFLAYGLAPLALFVYLFGRRRKRSVRVPVRDLPHDPDAGDPKSDQ